MLGRETPFPSWADVGFLGMSAGACAALWLYPAQEAGADRGRRLLDGLTVTCSLALVWWSTALGAVATAGGEQPLAFAVSLAYPAGDLVVVVMAVLVLCRVRSDRLALLLLTAGIAAIAVADSGFTYATATDAYAPVNALDLGWLGGFLLLALAPLAATGTAAAPRPGSGLRPVESNLPYAPVLLALSLLGVRLLTGTHVDAVTTVLVLATAVLVMLRQHLTHRDNAWLVTELAEREAQLRHRAFHDDLTGLANRALFSNRVAHALELHRRDLRPLAVLFCDLDDFKVVNDTHGHAAGDELLVRVAERLQGALRGGDTLARLGGDEFAVLLEDGGEPLLVAQKVADALRAPFHVSGRALRGGASIGVAAVPADAVTPTEDALLARADTAMYAAKRSGKGALRSFEPGMELVEVSDGTRRRALADAVRLRHLTLDYQPLVDPRTGRVAGVEALARWAPEGTPVPPQEFIALAERTDLIGGLTDLVLDLACAQLSAWTAELDRPDLQVGVNVSPQQVTDPGFPDRVADTLRRHGLQGSQLVLEITESGLLQDLEAARQVTARLRALGVALSLDDFGVGYSSLAHLSGLPVDGLKIDRAFLEGLGHDPARTRFVQALVRLGQDLELDVVAEGVERVEQLDMLRDLGCTLVQGYLLSRPVRPEALTRVLADGMPAHLLSPVPAP